MPIGMPFGMPGMGIPGMGMPGMGMPIIIIRKKNLKKDRGSPRINPINLFSGKKN
jgi:hypothetical protein